MPNADDLLVLKALGLTKKYGRRTALEHVDLAVPAGRVIGLVGPNGAGKSTLLHLATGLIEPTSGLLRVLGSRAAADASHLARVGFVAQDTPVYKSFTVEEHLRMGARLNPSWDSGLAERRVRQVGLRLDQKAGGLSGGQRAQLALTIAAAKRPELLIFDEPAAALDPLARHGFLENLLEFVAELGASAVLSSHLLGDISRACDYLIVLCGAKVQVADGVKELLDVHHRLVDPPERLPLGVEVIQGEPGGRRVIVRGTAVLPCPVEPVTLEELALAYMTRALGASEGRR
ncbi:ABC transporter ATP-binding protein [Spirillospora sp. CA-294931]|uniref:ABC transporter ATP-binding protein n=1 Tax=Spirillospora sp. CA-294931 TaxID=3240042 RepID=UPI003D942A1F